MGTTKRPFDCGFCVSGHWSHDSLIEHLRQEHPESREARYLLKDSEVRQGLTSVPVSETPNAWMEH
jgi:hypothetical protein